jgi:hypothetical protein
MDFANELNKFSALDFHPSHFKGLSDCLELHDPCKRAVGLDHGLPRRLVVDLVESPLDAQPFNPRLCMTLHIEYRPVSYVALSHSWSTLSEPEKLSMITTTGNKDERLGAIDPQSIPSNY